uniref:Cytochrome P450 n=1 Tax=Tetranychus urticae TaxID=32264 RepID=T1K5K9_TETUR
MDFYSGLFSVGSLKVLLFSVISYFVYVYLLKPALHYIYIVIHYHGFHYQPKSFLLGHVKQIWPNFPFPIEMKTVAGNLYEKMLKIVGPNPSRSLSVLWISIFPVVFASGHEVVEKILHRTNLKRPHFCKFLGLGDGLISSEPDVWKVRRKLIEPFFTTKKMRDHAKHMYEEVKSFGQQLDKEVGKPVDLVHQIHTSTLNIILKTSASIPLEDSIEDKERYVELVSTVERNAVKRAANPLYQLDWMFKLFQFSQVYYKAISSTVEIINKMFRRRKQLLKDSSSNEPENQDLVGLLEGKVDEQGLLDELITLIGAGHDTTAVALRWNLFNIGNHYDVQEKLYKEIIQFFPDDTPIDDMDKLKECVYLEQVIKESLRLNPSVPGTTRVLEEDIMLNDERLIKGSMVNVSSLATHYDPNVYPNPTKYDPDRWSPENASKIPKTAWIPFGYGPRICIGYRYAMVELKIYTAQIIRKFSLRSTRPHGSVSMLYEVTFQPSLPLEIIMTPRNNNQSNF